MYKLYWIPGSAAMAPQAMLNEIGAPCELIKIDDTKKEQRSAAYLRLNPHARVPTLVYDGEQVMYESAAICLFLAERHPEAKLAPALGHADRGRFLQWMEYLTNTLQETIMHFWHSDYFIDGEKQQAELKAHAMKRCDRMFGFLDGELKKSGPYLCGRTFTACDIYLAMLARWTRTMDRPAIVHPEVRRLVAECLTRPGYAKMLKDQGITQVASIS